MKLVKSFDVVTDTHGDVDGVRELLIAEVVHVAGGAGGSNPPGSSYQGGGNDGFGGSRRNP
jgi:hypothetical protein